MSERVLTFALTVLTTTGLTTQAVAREFVQDDISLIAQSASSTQQTRTASQPSAGVQRLQNRLAELGYYDGSLDGTFNASTREALAAFQRDNGLVGTGILDPVTSKRLTDPAIESATSETPDPNLTDPVVDEQPSDTDSQNTNDDLLAQSGSASGPLPEPPAGNAPEDLIEAAGAGQSSPNTDAANEVDGAMAFDDPTALADNGVPPESEAGDTNGAAVDEADNTSGFFQLVIVGLLILGLGGLGTGLLLWLAKRSSGNSSTPATTPPLGMTGKTPGMTGEKKVGQSFPQPPPPPTPPSHLRNGRSSTPQTPTAQLANVKKPTSSLDTTPESKVSKINIIDELINDLANPDPATRHKAIWELGQRGNSVAVQPLTRLLIEADSHEQSLVLAALSEISLQTLKPMNRAVAIALQGDNPEVRKNAIRDLTRIYDSLGQVGRLLGHASVDEDAEVRQTANWALEHLNQVRLTANESAGLLPETRDVADRSPEDGPPSH
jgi:peptidoglycan hydrolase-like protein with peptidoglycan-binding domain